MPIFIAQLWIRKNMFRGFIGIILIILLFSLFGCCNIFTPPANQTNIPVAEITLNQTQGYAPFDLMFNYRCFDPNNQLDHCELKIDGQTFAEAPSMDSLLPENYTYPDFYFRALNTTGEHTLEIIAVDTNGLNATQSASFTVLAPPVAADLSGPGWYDCNNLTNPPCDAYSQAYCDKFTPTDLSVREAASQAISKHPGQFSINQLLDIYDWVHTNIFYQNVPVNLTYQPYSPADTLATKSGDCKNQAVLIASMVEAIGGTARVLMIPECDHAFAEVYVGNDSNLDNLTAAVFAHYPASAGQQINWHTTKDANNQTENWFIFDTAGGDFPGQTIPECLNASSVFEIYDCANTGQLLQTPAVQGTEYGPYVLQNNSQIIEANKYYYSYVDPTNIPSTYKWCHYSVNVQSLSGPMDWFVLDQSGYNDFAAGNSFQYYNGGENVQNGQYEFDWTNSSRFYVLLNNRGQSSITVNDTIVETCYNS